MTNLQKTQLANSWQRLLQKWRETIKVWDDPLSRQFEQEFWQPLETEVAATRRELERLNEVITIIKREKDRGEYGQK
jgi:hypothetical protein